MLKRWTIQFTTGFVIGALIVGIFIETAETKEILQAVQALTITVATIFTAYWTSKTFAHQTRREEAKNIVTALQKIETALSNVSWAFVYKLTQPEKLNELKMELEVATELFARAIDETIYLHPSLRLRLMSLSADLSLSSNKFDDLTGRKSELKADLQKQIMHLKYEVIDTAYFDIGVEMRKLRNYLGF